MTLSVEVIEITGYVLLVCIGILSGLYVWGCTQVYKYRDVYPFNKRIGPLLVFWYGALTFQVVNVWVKQMYVDTACKLALSCTRYDIYRLLYGISACVLGMSSVGRGDALLMRHMIREAVVEMQQKKQLLADNWWVNHRHWLKDKVLYSVMLAYMLFVVVVLVAVYAIGLGGENMSFLLNVAHAMVFLSLIQTPYMIYQLRKRTVDNLGISRELGMVGYSALIGICIYTPAQRIFPEFTNQASIGDFFLLCLWGSVWYATVYVPLGMIDKAKFSAAVEVEQNQTVMSAAVGSKFSRTARDTTSVMRRQLFESDEFAMCVVFTSVECKDLSFRNILTSQKGYNAFLTFLATEFSSENLEFWKDAQELRAHCSRGIAKSLLKVGANGRTALALNSSPRAHNKRLSPKACKKHSWTTSSKHSSNKRDRASSSGGMHSTEGKLTLLAVPQSFKDDEDGDDDEEDNARKHIYPAEMRLPFVERARKIQATYCTKDSIQEINVKGSVQRDLAENMALLADIVRDDTSGRSNTVNVSSSKSVFTKTVPLMTQIRDALRPPLKEIMFLLEKDSFTRFLKSPVFFELKTNYEKQAFTHGFSPKNPKTVLEEGTPLGVPRYLV